jgi:hypothetical protein
VHKKNLYSCDLCNYVPKSKGQRLKSAITIFLTSVFLSVLTGCEAGGRKLLTVDFQPGQTLRYKFVSSRDIELGWSSLEGGTKKAESKVDKLYESMEMIVAYAPVEVDSNGLTTVKATCESVKVERKQQSGAADAVESLVGKSFTITVSPTGKMEDSSQLNELIHEIGEKAFRQSSRGGKIKNPDMIGDFVATQWFLWDAVASIKKPLDGVSVGRHWMSKLSVPTPMVSRLARNVTYTLKEIRQSEKGELAVIDSNYSLAESAPDSWPIPYAGSFQMSGTFGFLTRYKYFDLQGSGEELFNIDAGRTERYSQQYQLNAEASVPFGIEAGVGIKIKQNLTMQLLE